MTADLILHPEVWADIGRIRDWYGAISTRLANDFGKQLADLLDRIAAHPSMYAAVDAGYRRANLWRYPYQVFYVIAPHCVLVLGIFPDRADPEITWRRLRDRDWL